jgi:signal transduction histidine kinase
VYVEASLWRAVAVFRFAAFGYAVVLLFNGWRNYTHPWLGVGVLVTMFLWSIVSAFLYADRGKRHWQLLTADMVVTLGCLAASSWVIPPATLRTGSPTLPMAWVAGAVLSWAIAGGRRMAAAGALMVGFVDLSMRGRFTPSTVNGTVLLLLAGFSMGYLVHMSTEAETRLQKAVEMEAATRERERLARGIHDSVLQVLALVQKRGAELGGEAAELGRLAGEQEATLRALVGIGPPGPLASDDQCDLRALVGVRATASVSLAAPAEPVWLPCSVGGELASAVGSALDNVWRHCGSGAKAWVLIEDEPDSVIVTVRDNGPGFPAGRLAEAAADGRLGVAQSIQGRLRDLGGSAVITSTPGEGTEVEMCVPRLAGAASEKGFGKG